ISRHRRPMLAIHIDRDLQKVARTSATTPAALLPCPPRLGWFQDTPKRLPMLLSQVHHLRSLGLRLVAGKHPTLTHSLTVGLEHDTNSILVLEFKYFLQDVHDELHGRVVIVQEPNLESR